MHAKAHTRDLLPCRSNPSYNSPFQSREGYLPNVSDVVVWGCPCYLLTHLPGDSVGTKYPMVGKPMIHVDYPDKGPGWVLLNPETGNKCTAYHVLFDEAFALRVPKPKVSDFQDLFFMIRVERGR